MKNPLPSFITKSLVCGLAVACLPGCGSLREGFGNMGDKALETVGFKKPDLPKPPELPEMAKPPRPMRLLVSASPSLNLDAQGQPLSLVVRVYKLRTPTAFLSAPFDTFGDLARERQALGDDLLDVKELVIAPGHRRELHEKWAREAAFVGVVGLFLQPAPQRWRQAFDVAELTDAGSFSVGAHACALSVGQGTPVGESAAATRLRPTDCEPAHALIQPTLSTRPLPSGKTP